MSVYLVALLGIAVGLFGAAIGDMVSEEIRDRLDHLPHAVLRLGALRLDAEARTAIYNDEWLPELTYILKGDEARPVTRLYHGTRFAFGILLAARRIARDLHRRGWSSKYSDILPAWFDAYLGLESAAATIRAFEMQFVPGLFQTEDYARAVTRLGHQSAPAHEIERRVGLRLKRQELLARAQPPRIWAILDEAVLRRPVGGVAVMRTQLRHLALMARLPNVTIQVVLFACGGQAAASGSFSTLRFEEKDLPDVVYMEQLSSAVYLERRSDLEHYLGVVDQLSCVALTPAETIRLIEEAAQAI